MKTKKSQTYCNICVILLSISLIAIAFPVGAQTTLPSGVTPTNLQSGSSIPLPAGVTPDVTIDTIAYLSFTPNPIGLGQSLLVNIWFQPPVHVSRSLSGLTVTFTKPDGTKDVIGPIETYKGDATAWFEYIVDQIGTWKVRFDFPGGYFPAGNYTIPSGAAFGGGSNVSFTQSVYYKPATSGDHELIVQEQKVKSWPEAPLPTDYWTRPISPENREWWIIGGNCPFNAVGGGPIWEKLYPKTNIYMSNYKFTPWVQGPESAHIVWKLRGSVLSGIIGGSTGQWAAPVNFDEAYSTATGAYGAGPGSAGNPSILFQGRLYGKVMGVLNGTPMYIWRCTDVRTGEIIWEQPWTSQMPTIISTAFDAPLVPGATQRADRLHMMLVYLGGGRLIKYSPTNGQVLSNVSISPLTTGTVYADPYVLSVQDLGAAAGSNRYRLINWTMEGNSADLTTRVISNISWPLSSLPSVIDYQEGIAVTTSGITSPATGVAVDARIMAYSITTGQLLWNITAGVGFGIYSGNTAVADHGKFAIRMNDGHYYCWDLRTGKRLWKSESTSWPWDTFGAYYVSSAYGFLYDPTYSGLRAIDWETGKVAWVFEAPTPYQYETPYKGQYPWFSGNIIADGKIYAYNLEHSPTAPLTRGWRLFCINATTGKGIWNITGSMPPGLVADGYLTAVNWYDGYMYVFGKGKSQTTVTASPKVTSLGDTVLIEGKVLDLSPAQAGTPCVSKDSMTTQMEYLHMQHPIDGLEHNIKMTGVPVRLTAIDPNGNSQEIGEVVTNPYYGTFSISWKPPIEGDYTIMATFAGDESYGSSSAATAITVNAAPTATTTPEPVQMPDYAPLMYAILAIGIIAIILGIIAVLLVSRKK